jgi:hypothetical protein
LLTVHIRLMSVQWHEICWLQHIDAKLTEQVLAVSGKRVTLPAKNVSLAEWSNQSKENGNDEDDAEGALHARVQARGGAAGRRWPEHRGSGATLGVVDQTLFNWVKAHRAGKLTVLDSKP